MIVNNYNKKKHPMEHKRRTSTMFIARFLNNGRGHKQYRDLIRWSKKEGCYAPMHVVYRAHGIYCRTRYGENYGSCPKVLATHFDVYTSIV